MVVRQCEEGWGGWDTRGGGRAGPVPQSDGRGCQGMDPRAGFYKGERSLPSEGKGRLFLVEGAVWTGTGRQGRPLSVQGK